MDSAVNHPGPIRARSAERDLMDSTAVSHADQKDSPLSFYMDSAVNHPGPIRTDSKSCKYLYRKNYVSLRFYNTILVYHPTESKMDIFVTKVGHELSFYMDPTLSYHGRKNYIKGSTVVRDNSSQSKSAPKVTFHNSEAKSSESKVIFGSFGSQSSESKSSDFIFGNIGSQSSESKSVANVSKNYIPLSTAGLSSNSRNSIPDELSFSILSKLPVKSLKRFQCVSKSWSILFDNSHFMTIYANHFLSRHGSHDDYCTFILANHALDRSLYRTEFHLLGNKLKLNLPSPLPHTDYTCIVGSTSVNGIFCLAQLHRGVYSKSQYVLWNPLTQEFMVIPSSPAELTPEPPCGSTATVFLEHRFHGFGYDQGRHDFKVIHYVSFVSLDDHRLTTSFFEIYSLKSNSWRMIDMDNDLSHWTYLDSMPFSGREVYLNGACHWLVSDCIDDRRCLILLSFNLTSEMFVTTPIGEEPRSPHSTRGRLTVLNGSIALISNYHDDIVLQISILGQLGVAKSWIKLYTYGPLPSIRWAPIGFGKMGHIFFKKKDYELAYADLRTQIIEEGLVDIQEAILRQLDDKDLTVVQAALNVEGLQNVLGASKLIETLASCCLEDLFPALVFLCRSANSGVQSATKEALMRIDIDFSTVGHILDLILAPKCGLVRSADEKTIKRQKLTTDQEAELPTNDICTIDDPVYLLSSLLDVLLLKKGITNRHILLDPLFKLLSMLFSEEWVNGTLSLEEGSSQPSSSPFESVNHIQQTLLIIMEDIIMSLKGIAALNEKMTNKINITLLIECARSTNVLVIRNHIFSLLSAVIKVLPEKVFEHILDILPVIGESAVT